ncbi:hypothetical protein EJB05_54233, partial [Eragrostis curvula]
MAPEGREKEMGKSEELENGGGEGAAPIYGGASVAATAARSGRTAAAAEAGRRFKLKFVSFRLCAGWGDKAGEYLGKVKKTIKDLFLAYSSAMPSSNSENTQSGIDNQLVVDEDNPWADFEQLLVAQKKNKMKSELDQYLQDDLFPRQKDFDILKWWMMHVTKYPILSRMTQDVLVAPATSVASDLHLQPDWLRAQGRADVNIVDIVSTDDILEENS